MARARKRTWTWLVVGLKAATLLSPSLVVATIAGVVGTVDGVRATVVEVATAAREVAAC
jgi:preprotein translocase subunit YajC